MKILKHKTQLHERFNFEKQEMRNQNKRTGNADDRLCMKKEKGKQRQQTHMENSETSIAHHAGIRDLCRKG